MDVGSRKEQGVATGWRRKSKRWKIWDGEAGEENSDMILPERSSSDLYNLLLSSLVS